MQATELPLGQLVETMQAGTRPAGGAEVVHGGVPSLGGENVTRDGLLVTRSVRTVPTSFFKSMKRGVLRSGDVVINKDGAQTGKVARYQGEFDRAAVNEHLFLLRGKPSSCDPGYLYWLMMSARTQRQIARFITGSAQPGLGQGFLRGVSVPGRDLLEQEALAKVLDASQRELATQTSVVQKLVHLKDGLSQQLFGGDVVLRELRSLVAAPICYGVLQPGKFDPHGVELITIGDARRSLSRELFRIAPFLDAQYARSRVIGGDLLTSVKGTIGVVFVVPEGFKGNISRDVARVRVTDEISAEYLCYFFQSQVGQGLLERSVVGTTRAEISIGVLNRMLVPVPAQAEQERVVSVLGAIDARITSERSLLEKQRLTHAGLVEALLWGEESQR